MKIAVTGGPGFIGHYLLRWLVTSGHSLRCWYRPTSDRAGLEDIADAVVWLPGELNDEPSADSLVSGCDAIVHAALYRPGAGFRGAEGDLVEFAERNVIGTLRLIEAARRSGVGRFVFISTCAVHEQILDDRPLDENHPTRATSHYDAHKAAIEQFVHSYGLGLGYPICALRPSGVYGLARPPEDSKWFDLVSAVVKGQPIICQRGGKEVHAADVAKAAELLLNAPADKITGQAFNCCDQYISEWDVAHFAKQISGSAATIRGQQTSPKNQIVTKKLRSLGMKFGGRQLLETTVRQLVQAAQSL
ncbi:MAG TPA: NAD(P)-dependent oxidoreductase [Pirellulaceae bacterium]|jgi:nucleoside-diphosphate-sugar epimerase